MKETLFATTHSAYQAGMVWSAAASGIPHDAAFVHSRAESGAALRLSPHSKSCAVNFSPAAQSSTE